MIVGNGRHRVSLIMARSSILPPVLDDAGDAEANDQHCQNRRDPVALLNNVLHPEQEQKYTPTQTNPLIAAAHRTLASSVFPYGNDRYAETESLLSPIPIPC